MYRFVGRLLGKAIYDRHVLDVPLCTFMFKRILRQVPVLEDVKELDPVYHTSLQWMLDNTITGIIDETFSVLRDDFGSHVVVDLCPNGRNIEGKAKWQVLEQDHFLHFSHCMHFLLVHFFTCSLFVFLLLFSKVTEDNKVSYVQHIVEYITGSCVKSQLNALLMGFGEIIPRHAIGNFTSQELKALVNGKDTIDAKSLRYVG